MAYSSVYHMQMYNKQPLMATLKFLLILHYNPTYTCHLSSSRHHTTSSLAHRGCFSFLILPAFLSLSRHRHNIHHQIRCTEFLQNGKYSILILGLGDIYKHDRGTRSYSAHLSIPTAFLGRRKYGSL